MMFGVNIATAQQSSVPSQFYGVWNRGGEPEFSPNPDTNPDYEKFDFLKGKGITKSLKWSEIQEANDGVFNFTPFEEAINQAFADGQLVTLKINVGPQAPEWIYGDGSGLVDMDGLVAVVETGNEKFPKHPYYWDPDYISLYYSLIDEFADFVYGLPPEKQEIIAFIFPQNGATGDEVAYKGTPPEEFEISDELWADFREASWLHWRAAFRVDRARPMPFLFNDLQVDSREWNFVKEEIGTDFGIKNSNGYCRGHHLTGGKSWHQAHHKFLVNPSANDEGLNQGLVLFNRAEMDQSWNGQVFQVNQNLGFYWAAISGLNTGLSVWDVTSSALEQAAIDENESIRDSFRFFNKYATQVNPADSTKAFIALHEGLDVTDTVKFPVDEFGELGIRANTGRFAIIAAAYEGRGALLLDEVAVRKGQVAQRSSQTLYNDVGWDIWPTNYSRFITQVDPDAESIGLFRVGIGKRMYTVDDPVYSRFARSFENKSGKNQMNFKMENGFFTSDAGIVKFTITYYDKNEGSTWELRYDAGEGPLKTAAHVVCNGTKKWITKDFIVADAVMRENGPGVADFALVNSDADENETEDILDDIFHMIEVEQLEELPFLMGDVNRDGTVNLLDVAPFIGLLSSGIYQMEADINDDWVVNLLDIAPFIAILRGN